MYQVFVAFALLASAMSVNKVILQVLPPTLFVGLRMGISGFILLLATWYKNPRYSFAYLKRDWLSLLGVSFFTTLIPSILKAYAFKYMISSKAAFLGSLDPFITALYTYLLLSEKLSVQKIIGMIIGFCGTMVLLITSSPAESTLKAWWIFSYPELAALLAMALGRLGWLIVQQLLRKERYTSYEVNGMCMFVSGFTALLLSFLWDQQGSLVQVMNIKYGGLLLYTIIMGNLIAYSLYANLLKKYSATFVSLAGFSVPLYVYFYGWLFLDEPLSGNFILASSITFVGLIVFYYAEIHRRLWWRQKKITH